MAEASEKVCPACWARNSANTDVCRACGARLTGEAGASAPRAEEAEPASPPGAARIAQPPKTGPASIEPQMLAGRYRLVFEIARGGMGIVYFAEDTFLDDLKVAIKLLPATISPDLNAEKRLKREALTAMSLSHDNIMRLYSFDQYQGQSFLVMEYINGPTLEGLTLQRSRLTPAETALFMRPVCEALDYAHGKGVVHRDIKPANIMLSLPDDSPFSSKLKRKRRAAVDPSSPTVAFSDLGGGEAVKADSPPAGEHATGKPLSEFGIDDAQNAKVKICDFGIAQQLRQTMTRLTGTSLIGSPIYMSPEQLEGAKVDHRTDIYALGVSVYEMLTGNPPFDGPMHSLTYQIMEKGPPPVKGVDRGLSDVVLKCMAKDPRDRWQTCAEFAAALEAALEGRGTQVTVPESAYGRRAKTMRQDTGLSSTVSTRRTPADKTRATDRRMADLRMANLSFEEKLYDKALEEMKQFRLLHGDSDDLLNFAAQCVDALVQRRAFAQAHDYCQFVVLIDSENPNVYLTLGRIERVLGRSSDAERNLRLAMMYGAEDGTVEKELRGTLSDIRGEAGGFRIFQLTPARIGAFVASELAAIGFSITLALLLTGGRGEHSGLYLISGVMLAVIAGAASILLATAFSGPLTELGRRAAGVKAYLARHGYAVGLLAVAIMGALSWLLSRALFPDQTEQPEAFVLVFGTVVWLGSILYSWFVVHSALTEKRSRGIP